MFRYSCLPHPVPFRPNRAGLLLAFAFIALLFAASSLAHAQFSAPNPGTHVMDTTALHTPAGARVAIVEFVDMECPICGTTNPIIRAAAARYKIPLVRHDFLIPAHAWSPTAALNARWFDTKSKALGDEYRDEVFANQVSIYNPSSLDQFTQKFAQSHSLSMPFALDPQGKLAAEIDADIALGIQSTPTIFVVEAGGKGTPFKQVMNPAQQLYTDIDQAIADTASAPKATVAKKTGGK
jgi:protein-disulfide isomerase